MFCPECREERLTRGLICAVCGGSLSARPREELERELAHVRYVLQDSTWWGEFRQARQAREFLLPRYETRQRLLQRALDGEEASIPVEEPILEATPVTLEPQPEPVAPPLPAPGLHEPVFDLPASPPTPTQEAVEAVSTWRSVWRPFLYESIGWFIGAFLVVAGSIYFVALGWSGMSDVARAVTIFALTAGYSAAFSIVGALLLRREALAGAGRVVSLIGSAMAPFAPLAFAATGQHAPLLFGTLAALWSLLAAWLVRFPVRAYDAPSVRWLMGATAASIAGTASTPWLVTTLGAGSVWVASAGVIAAVGGARAARGRTVEQALFAILAPAYLCGVLLVRLHTALIEGGVTVPLSSYAPFLAVITFLALRTWPREGPLPAAVAVAVTALQLTLIVAGGFGQAPAFFLTSGVALWTALWLAKHAKGEARWLYLAYVFGYLAYQSVGQLVPGWLQELLVRVRTLLGYPPGADLPFNYAALYALPFVVAVAVLAVRWLRGGEKADAAEVLLHATAGAILFFSAEALAGSDLRPAVWAAAPLGGAGLLLGAGLNRAYLSRAGWCALLLFGAATSVVSGAALGALLSAGLALAIALWSWRAPRAHALAQGALLQTVLSALLAASVTVQGEVPSPLVVAALLAVIAAWAAWRMLRHPAVELWALALTAALPPLAVAWWNPALAPVALALTAIGLALLWTRFAAPMATAATLVAAGWQAGLVLESVAFGGVVLAAVVANALAARRHRWLGVVAAFFWTVLLLPSVDGPLEAARWPYLSPLLSCAAYAATALGASLHAVRSGRGPVNVAAALFAALTSMAAAVLFSIFGGDQGPLLLVSAAAVLLASPALRAELCIPVATLLVLSHAGWSGHEGRLTLAVALTALALGGVLREGAARWMGTARGPRVAAFCAAAVLALGLVAQPKDMVAVAFVAAAAVLPVLWFAGTRAPVFLSLAAMVAVLAGVGISPPAALAPLLAVAAVSRWRSRSGQAPSSGWLMAGLGGAVLLWSAAIVFGLVEHTEPILPIALALATLASGGLSLSSRFVLIALGALLVPQLRGLSAGGVLVLGLCSVHFPAALDRLLRPAEAPHPRQIAAGAAVALSVAALLDVASWAGWFFTPAVALLGATALLAERRLLTLSVIAAGAGVLLGADALGLRQPSVALLVGALLVAGLAVLWRSVGGRRQEPLVSRLAPGIDPRLDTPLWFAAAALLTAWLGVWVTGAAPMSPLEPALALSTAFLLWRVEARLELAFQVCLWAAVSLVALPDGISGVLLGASAVTLVLRSRQRRGELPMAGALLRAGGFLALVALAGSGGLGAPLFPVAVLGALVAIWLAAARTRERVAWLATLIAAHLWIFHLGVVFSSGRGAEFILPFLAAGAAIVAAVAGLLPPAGSRRFALLGAGLLACVELALALVAIPSAGGREALAAASAMALLGAVLVFAARRDDDEAPAFLAQIALLLGYLGARVLAFDSLHGGDGLVGLVAGAVFSGLHVWARRDAQARRAFVRPALFAAYVFPLAGLLAAPWEISLAAAALLVGHAAHFAVLGGTATRRLGALVSALAFNAALFFVWQGTHAGQAEHYVIPFGLSLLVLGHVFRHELDEVWHARLRAVAITTVYSASAWRALLFTDPLSLGLCALACVVGVAAGIALRIRSFVYLGTGFLVTTVAANLVRAGLREPHLGALFLSILGVLVVGFMVLFTAQRAEVLRRYDRMRSLLAEWEG